MWWNGKPSVSVFPCRSVLPAVRTTLFLLLASAGLAGCTVPAGWRSTAYYGQTAESAPLPPSSASGAPAGAQLAAAPGRATVPAGFRAVPEAVGIHRPAGLAVDGMGGIYVIEDGDKLVRLGAAGGRDLIDQGAADSQWTGLAASGGLFYVTGTSRTLGGYLLRLDLNGRGAILMEGLPSGDHPVDAPAVGPDGMVYIGVGSVTETGIAGPDAPWRKASPSAHDVPCQDVRLTGRNLTHDSTVTGAFVPYGTSTRAGQMIEGRVPCSAAVLRTGEDDGRAQLVAWGFGDPRSMAFTPEGRLYLLDGDKLFAVAAGIWYGWPDVAGARPLLARHPNPPPRPLAVFAKPGSARALDLARAPLFGGATQAYVAVDLPKYGFRIVRVDLRDGTITDFAEFPGGTPPVALRFSHSGNALYVLEEGGTLWRIERDIPIG